MTTARNTTARRAAGSLAPTRRRVLAGLGGVLLSTAAIGGARAQTIEADAAQTVRSFYDILLHTMHDGPKLGARGRYERLAPVIDDTFDLGFMTRTAVGPRWYRFSATEQDNVVKAFRRYVVATYADNFDDYSGESLTVIGEHPVTAGRVVETRIVKSDGTPVTLSYLMHDDGSGWRIRDVYLDGQISELAVRRSQFVSILSAQGTDGLIAMLNQKADKLAPQSGS